MAKWTFGQNWKCLNPLSSKTSGQNFPKISGSKEDLNVYQCANFGEILTREKYFTLKFRKFRLGGPGPQTVQNIWEWLGGVCRGCRPPSTCAVSSLHNKSFPSNWGSKKNLWRHLASKPEVGRSRDLTGRRGSTGSTLCQNLGSFGRPVSELWDVEVSVESPYYVQKYENGLV